MKIAHAKSLRTEYFGRTSQCQKYHPTMPISSGMSSMIGTLAGSAVSMFLMNQLRSISKQTRNDFRVNREHRVAGDFLKFIALREAGDSMASLFPGLRPVHTVQIDHNGG